MNTDKRWWGGEGACTKFRRNSGAGRVLHQSEFRPPKHVLYNLQKKKKKILVHCSSMYEANLVWNQQWHIACVMDNRRSGNRTLNLSVRDWITGSDATMQPGSLCGPNVRVLNFHQSLLTFALVPQHDKYVTRNPYLHALALDSPSCSVIQKHRTKGSVLNLIKQMKQIRSKWSGRIKIRRLRSPSGCFTLAALCAGTFACVFCAAADTLLLSWKSAKNPFVWRLLYHTIRQSTS